jgi:hypothetical protein
MQDRISARERTLIEAARRDLENRRARPANTGAPESSAGVMRPPIADSKAAQPVVTAISSPIQPAASTPESIATRIALLIEAEREEKSRRLRTHQRWKFGAIAVFSLLIAWFALTILGHMRH